MTQRETSGWAVGWTAFAAVMMMIMGMFHGIAGFVGVIQNDLYVVGSEYVFQFDTTTWGWIHMGLGLLVFLAGLALLNGATWARVIGVILAVVSMVANFAWLPYYPFWSIVIIATCAFVIWALTAHGHDIVDR